MKRALAIALLLGAALLHWPSEPADFSYDDIDFVVSNASIRSPDAALSTLLAPFPPEQRERGLYRPLTNLSYAADYAWTGLEAAAYHRTNVLLYAAVVLVAAWLYRATLPGAGLALAAALVFAFHPVHSEAIDSISGRSELLALLFSLLALRVFEAARAARGRGAALYASTVGLFYALACLSKETAVVLPGILVARVVIAEWPGASGSAPAPSMAGARARRMALLVGPSALLLIGYFALRLYVLGGFTPGMRVLDGEPFAARLWTMGAIYAEYLRLLLWPSVLQLDFYYQAAVGIVRRPGVAPLIGIAAAVLALTACARGAFAQLASHRSHADAQLRENALADAPLRTAALTHAAIALAFFFPVSHVIGFGALMAERFLFAPSFGLAALACLLVHSLLGRWIADPRARRATAIGLLALFVVASGARSLARAAEWRDGVALWSSAARLLPADARVHANLGKQYLDRGNLVLAESALERALELEPDQQAARLNLGVVRERQGRDGEALETYRRLLETWPDDFVAWTNRGVVEARSGALLEADRSFAQALAINPNSAEALANRAHLARQIATARRFLTEKRHAAEEGRDAELARTLARVCRGLEETCAAHFERLALQHQGARGSEAPEGAAGQRP